MAKGRFTITALAVLLGSMWLLADQLAVVIFQRGQFTAADAHQTADMIACYGVGVWAFCGLSIVQRGYMGSIRLCYARSPGANRSRSSPSGSARSWTAC